MEPTLTSPEPADDPLEALLRAAPRAIPDNGFTTRVCAALPPRGASAAGARRLVLSGASLMGCLLAWLAWSRLDPTWPVALVAAARGWSFAPWHGLLFVIALSAWAVIRDAREGGVIAGS
jgi:anti-sigma factor RsiW